MVRAERTLLLRQAMQADLRGFPFCGRSNGGPVERITYELLLCFQVLNMIKPKEGKFEIMEKTKVTLMQLHHLYQSCAVCNSVFSCLYRSDFRLLSTGPRLAREAVPHADRQG
jgi:hypothetical protein